MEMMKEMSERYPARSGGVGRECEVVVNKILCPLPLCRPPYIPPIAPTSYTSYSSYYFIYFNILECTYSVRCTFLAR